MQDILIVEGKLKEALSTIPELRTVESYEGTIEDLAGSTRLPAALIVYGGARAQSEEGTRAVQTKVDVYFTVYVIAKNTRGKAEASVDVRTLLEVSRNRIHALAFNGITVKWEEETLEMMTPDGICAYAQHYRYQDYIVKEKGLIK
ncbi:phage protein Gp37 [Candidatus Magnetominusculus xianensis]|uniref:DUF3168 domain-containing protein n=1 Tax=Candidatus Magnetominusculus xianensis TaxID=1748249 RepID=A0ABR5SCG0_9BACT|nr:phage protein Gp37 [Candidatus Magnetominusculus xianensis]KWT81144.1 hypothetical protein ASN18_2650 [Candidatus Magnetominusculus xianensis]MBF0402974.1 DUF1834 family protein [Nitrospirota bacterium]